MADQELLAERLAAITGRLGFWVPLLICTWLALIPEPPDNPVFRLGDVILHGAAFTFLTFSFVLMRIVSSIPDTGRFNMSPTTAVQALMAMLGYGLTLELVQSVIPERSAELKDLLIDLAGIGFGLLLAALFAGWAASLLRYLARNFCRMIRG